MRMLVLMEPTLKYHPGVFEVLTLARVYRDWETDRKSVV